MIEFTFGIFTGFLLGALAFALGYRRAIRRQQERQRNYWQRVADAIGEEWTRFILKYVGKITDGH